MLLSQRFATCSVKASWACFIFYFLFWFLRWFFLWRIRFVHNSIRFWACFSLYLFISSFLPSSLFFLNNFVKIFFFYCGSHFEMSGFSDYWLKSLQKWKFLNFSGKREAWKVEEVTANHWYKRKILKGRYCVLEFFHLIDYCRKYILKSHSTELHIWLFLNYYFME